MYKLSLGSALLYSVKSLSNTPWLFSTLSLSAYFFCFPLRELLPWPLSFWLPYLETSKELFQGVAAVALIIALPLSHMHLMASPSLCSWMLRTQKPCSRHLLPNPARLSDNSMRKMSSSHSKPLGLTSQISLVITRGRWTGQLSHLSTSYSGNNGHITAYKRQLWEGCEHHSSGNLQPPPCLSRTVTHTHIEMHELWRSY